MPRKSSKPRSYKPLLFGIRPAPRIDKSHRINSKEWAESGVWVNVHSSNVSAIMYDREREMLFVSFHNGSTYQYSGVSERTARDLFNASSVGRAVWQILRAGGYPYTKL